MADSLIEKLSGTTLKTALLQTVVSEDIDQIPPEFNDLARFVICSVRVLARRQSATGISAFIYSEAPAVDGKPLGFQRIMHMQDGHGTVLARIILTSRDANNGASLPFDGQTLEELADRLEELNLQTRATVIWDATARVATVYPEGINNDQIYIRFVIPASAAELTQDDICSVLNTAYNDNLKNPSGRTIKLWTKGSLTPSAEEEIERHLKGQIALFFAGRERPIQVLSQTNTAAGRTDLILMQKSSTGGPRLSGVIELKVLRGPSTSDLQATTEGLSQGYHYRAELEIPFSTLALFDVNDPPSDDVNILLQGQDPEHVAMVRVRRFPIYNSPKAWRDAGAPKAA